MEEIKVGEYIKTVAGYIGKIINFNDGMYTARMKDVTIDLYIDDIKNHKENIIDLIEVGDYVNGSYVEGFIEKNKFQNKLIITEAGMIDNNDIKSIVTREAMKSVEYTIE